MNSFLGQIIILPINFAPPGYAFCDGRLLLISEYTALFSLIGTTFGGNGTTDFALPNYTGQAPTGSNYFICIEMGGSQSYPERRLS
jgi:microcystin-dependent protein